MCPICGPSQLNTYHGLKPDEQQIENISSIIVDDFLVNDDAGSEDQFVPSIAMDAAGNFVIVWYDFKNASWDIYFQRYNGEVSPVVCADNSSIIFSWQDNRRPEKWDIYAKIVSWSWNGVTTEVDEGKIHPKDFSIVGGT